MVVIDEKVVGVWYVTYKEPVAVLTLLRKLEDHFEVKWFVKGYDADNNPIISSEHVYKGVMIPMSAAIDNMRTYSKAGSHLLSIHSGWECLRGARSLLEFRELLAKLPNTRMCPLNEASEVAT